MKRLTSAIALIICFACIGSGQAKTPEATLFDTVPYEPRVYWPNEINELNRVRYEKRIARYAAALRAAKATPYIISYGPRVNEPGYWKTERGSSLLGQILWALTSHNFDFT
jgi:hypothetical protein